MNPGLGTRSIQPTPITARVVGGFSLAIGLGLVLFELLNAYVCIQPEPFTRLSLDPTEWGFGNRWLDGWLAFDIISALLLDFALIVAGVGLIRLRERARRLGLWVAVLKIVRLMVLVPILILLVEPDLARSMGLRLAAAEIRSTKLVPAQWAQVEREWIDGVGVVNTGFDCAILLLGPIFPAIMIWKLTRPGVRSACDPGGIELESPCLPDDDGSRRGPSSMAEQGTHQPTVAPRGDPRTRSG